MLKTPTFFLRAQKWSRISKKCHEAHQIDQRNVLNAKMYVVGAKRVKIVENWSNLAGRISSSSFRHRPPSPSLYIHP